MTFDDTLRLRVPGALLSAVTAAAENELQTVSTFTRRALLHAVRECGFDPLPPNMVARMLTEDHILQPDLDSP